MFSVRIISVRGMTIVFGGSPAPKNAMRDDGDYRTAANTVKRRKIFSRLHHAELHPARFTDHVLVPGRIPDELAFSFVHAVDRKNLALRIMRNRRAHSASGGGEAHLHGHFHSR